MTYCGKTNGRESYSLALDVIRERCIRQRQILPREGDAKELRWSEEGPRGWHDLDTVAGKKEECEQ